MTNVLDKIIEDKKESLKVIKKTLFFKGTQQESPKTGFWKNTFESYFKNQFFLRDATGVPENRVLEKYP